MQNGTGTKCIFEKNKKISKKVLTIVKKYIILRLALSNRANAPIAQLVRATGS